jgi:hypothetical protein
MPKPQSGENKKHGDKLEDLIERTGGKASPERPGQQRAANPADVQQDDEDVLDERDEDELEEEEGEEDEGADDERSDQQH